ncbi:LOW QUALITY PROTEIN: TBC1 domain family member 30-like [Podargus strigoides]
MRQDRLTGSLRRGGRCLKRQSSGGGVGTILSNVLKKRSCISRTAPRLLCTLEPGVDTKLKLTLELSLGQNGFQQWHDALKAVARLPTGIPKEQRRKVWLTLADQYLHSIAIDWDKTMHFTFNERSNPDDDSMGIQIVKDLHRTGCSSYCGQEAEQDRVVLKCFLLANARWNKSVGYCQGFNILAALILEVMEGNEGDALKIALFEHTLFTRLHLIDQNEEQSLGSSNTAELLSPGAIDSCRSEYHAAFNSMMMERMTTDINALKKQYSRIKKKQQQQVHHVYIRAGSEDDNPGIFLGPRDQLNDDKGPVTSLLPSQVNHSPVINHLLLGKKMKLNNRSLKNAVIHIPSHATEKMSPIPQEDLKTKLNSLWRTHIRVHRKNIARAKGQLGYGDTVGLIDEQSENCKTNSPGSKEETSKHSDFGEREGGGLDDRTTQTADQQSSEPVSTDSSTNMSVVQLKLEALELTSDNKTDGESTSHQSRQTRLSESSSSSSDSGWMCVDLAKSPQPGNPKPQVFNLFPSVKPLRKSATARNLGLYGPTERTPTVHFPQMSRSFSKSASGNSGTRKQ